MLLLRDSPHGPEVLMTRRADKANFAAGAYVFPGGAIDPTDHDAHGIAVHRPQQTGHVLTQAIAAIRECFEEMGVLLAYRADGSMADAQDVAALDRIPPTGENFTSQCAARGLQLAADQLRHFARWIADPANPKRFDTAFFVVRMPEGQVPVADDTEQFEPVWLRPVEALERHKAGTFLLIFPTIRTLERLSLHADVAAIVAVCAGEEPLTYNATRSGMLRGELTRLTGGDAGYGDVALISPDAQVVPVLDWQHETPVPLLKNVTRLTLPDGVNRYQVGDAATGYVAVQPGVSSSEPLILAGPEATHTLSLLQMQSGKPAGLLLQEDGLLFSCPGIELDPELAKLCADHRIGFVLPAAGYVKVAKSR
ncbi:MAG: hypothetical protein H7332_13545 [Bdellovibrionales bacterium]|nr:hypothetical protein [Ramlibacter sp.]